MAKPLVVGLVGTAGAVVLLLLIVMVIRCAAQTHQRNKRAGRGPAGSARRKTKHTKLDSTDTPERRVADAEDDDDEDEDDILGDEDYDPETAVRDAQPTEPVPADGEQESIPQPETESMQPAQAFAAASCEVVDADERELMRKVYGLLGELPGGDGERRPAPPIGPPLE